MADEKLILNWAVNAELSKHLDDFRFSDRIKSNSEAIRRLLGEALKKYESKPSKAFKK